MNIFPIPVAIRAGAAFLFALCLASTASASVLKTDTAKSTIGATFKQLNVPVDAKFKKFTAQIDYDAAKPDASKASVDIDITSFDLGDPEYNQEILKKEWFNAVQFPKASFVSTGMKAGAAGSLNVSGKLTIKGKTIDVSFPLNIKKDGNNTVFDGSLPIKRLVFNIGDGEWRDTATVADDVIIKFHVVATP
ncbi:MAG TPA: YceI family protein [Burkholderiaceae bacterium]|nr:YceI family protein [Burkholderiaceae bacterium]